MFNLFLVTMVAGFVAKPALNGRRNHHVVVGQHDVILQTHRGGGSRNKIVYAAADKGHQPLSALGAERLPVVGQNALRDVPAQKIPAPFERAQIPK